MICEKITVKNILNHRHVATLHILGSIISCVLWPRCAHALVRLRHNHFVRVMKRTMRLEMSNILSEISVGDFCHLKQDSEIIPRSPRNIQRCQAYLLIPPGMSLVTCTAVLFCPALLRIPLGVFQQQCFACLMLLTVFISSFLLDVFTSAVV